MKEIWKEIELNGKKFLISNYGKVFSKDKNSEEKMFLSGRGYYSISVWFGSRKNRKNYIVSRLVAKAFIPNPNNLPQVNHIDGNKLNNCVDNLEWCSASYNNIHAIKTGLRTYKNRMKSVAKIKDGIVVEEYGSMTEACIKNNVDSKQMWCVLNHKKGNIQAKGFKYEYIKRKS